MRRALLLLCSMWASAAIAFPSAAAAAPAPAGVKLPGVDAQAAAVVDVESGRLLYSKMGDKSLPIASLTKIMTAIVAIENGRLSDSVKVSKTAFGKEGSSIYLKLGQEMSLQHMLYGLMLRSGNDAATAIAEHVGGSVDGFVYLMNMKAEELGLSQTHFANPHGLDAKDHYASANDVAKLSAYALRNPVFREIVKTQMKRVPNPSDGGDYIWYNKNKMLSVFEGADGVKTGYTKIAKRCLVSSATRDGRQVVVVTLNDPNDWVDHTRLLQYGFDNFRSRPLIAQGESVEAGLAAGRAFAYPLTEAETAQVTRKLERTDPREAKYRLGIAGTLRFYLSGAEIGAVPVVPQISPRLNWKDETAFSFKRGDDGAASAPGGNYSKTLRSLLRTLFEGGGRHALW